MALRRLCVLGRRWPEAKGATSLYWTRSQRGALASRRGCPEGGRRQASLAGSWDERRQLARRSYDNPTLPLTLLPVSANESCGLPGKMLVPAMVNALGGDLLNSSRTRGPTQPMPQSLGTPFLRFVVPVEVRFFRAWAHVPFLTFPGLNLCKSFVRGCLLCKARAISYLDVARSDFVRTSRISSPKSRYLALGMLAPA